MNVREVELRLSEQSVGGRGAEDDELAVWRAVYAAGMVARCSGRQLASVPVHEYLVAYVCGFAVWESTMLQAGARCCRAAAASAQPRARALLCPGVAMSMWCGLR